MDTKAAATSNTTTPGAPPCTRTPRARPTTRMTIAWMKAISPERTTCERTIESRLAGVARKRSTTWRSRSVIIAMPAHVPPKKAFMITIAVAMNSKYDVVPNPPPGRFVTRLKSCP